LLNFIVVVNCVFFGLHLFVANMKIQSFVYIQNEIQPVEVEIALVRGLPQLYIVGLPDQAIKESQLRIKSAIRSSGYEWPKAKQIVVNLKPSQLKKTGVGLELAISSGILWATGQVKVPADMDQMIVYGELGLNGEVSEPQDLKNDVLFKTKKLLTGMPLKIKNGFFSSELRFSHYKLNHLKNLGRLNFTEIDSEKSNFKRPHEFENYYFSQQQAKIIKICALGGHSALFAGRPGTGKSLLTSVIHSLREIPNEEFENFSLDPETQWRPLIRPHHSTPMAAIIGGSAGMLHGGEIRRAHGGVFVTDELLEFAPSVVEALREPSETGLVRIARNGQVQNYHSQFQWLATTNLCPCGVYEPAVPSTSSCRFSIVKCRSYAMKLSGPLVDRFHFMTFASDWRGPLLVSWKDLRQELEAVREWKSSDRAGLSSHPSFKLNANLSFLDLQTMPCHWMAKKYIEDLESLSQRRLLATLRVARTIADLEMNPQIEAKHLTATLDLTVKPFERLERWE
jgi:magnesium chelatase family protein